MSQERLSGCKVSENLNYEKTIEDFAAKKSRKIKFKRCLSK